MQALTEEQAARMRAKLRDVRPPCRIPPSLGPHPTLAPCRLSQSLPCHVSGAQRLRVAAARRRPNRAPVCRRLPSGRGLRDGAKVSCRGAGRGLTATPAAANAGGHRTVCDVRCAILAHALTTTMIDNRHTLILSDYSRLGGTGTPPIPVGTAHTSRRIARISAPRHVHFFSRFGSHQTGPPRLQVGICVSSASAPSGGTPAAPPESCSCKLAASSERRPTW